MSLFLWGFSEIIVEWITNTLKNAQKYVQQCWKSSDIQKSKILYPWYIKVLPGKSFNILVYKMKMKILPFLFEIVFAFCNVQCLSKFHNLSCFCKGEMFQYFW